MSMKRLPLYTFPYPRKERASRVLLALRASYPGSLTAKQLMTAAGLSWRNHPVVSFASLCSDFICINQEIRADGWQAVRSGGDPDGVYWLSPTGEI